MTQQFNNNFEREFDWNDTIRQDAKEYVLLQPGEYWFTVEKYERGRHGGSDKLPPCPKAVVTLIVDTPQGKAILKHNLFLHSQTEGMLSAFFGAIGLKQHDQPLQMDWNRVPGTVGVCKVKNRVYNGNTFNDVQSMIYASDVDPTKQLNARPGQQPVQQAYTQPQSQQMAQQQMQQPAQGQWQQGQF